MEDAPTKKEINGFTVVPVALPETPLLPGVGIHYLYVGPYKPAHADAEAPRALLLENIPFDSTELNLKHLLSVQIGLPAGRVERVDFESDKRERRLVQEMHAGTPAAFNPASAKKKPGKKNTELVMLEDLPGAALPPLWDRKLQLDERTAVAVFVDIASQKAALKALQLVWDAKEKPVWCKGIEDREPPLGIDRYLRHLELRNPDPDELMESLDVYMAAYNEREQAQKQAQAQQRQEPDADGFVKVSRGGRSHPGNQSAAQLHAAKQSEKRKGLEDFYRFQAREQKKAKAAELLQGFDQDREKIRKMRQSRQG